MGATEKDAWDKFQIVATLLIPASIAWVGYAYSESQKSAEIESSMRIADQQNQTAKVSARVGQAQLVASFMDSLLSQDSQKQRLAIEAILIALPDDGPRLVAVVSKSSPNPEVRSFATTTLNERRTQLIQAAFSEDKSVRVSATEELAQGWRSDPNIVPELLEAARRNPENKDGIVNTLVVLESVDRRSLTTNAPEVDEFIRRVQSAGPVTQTHAERLKDKLHSPK